MSWATISTEMSTTQEPNDSADDTPPSTATRAAITSPPMEEKGSTSEAASRDSLPPMNTGRALPGEVDTNHQAKPSGANSTTWAAITIRKPPSPMGAMAFSTAPTLK